MIKRIAYIGVKRESLRLPDKNILNFAGKPLFQWSVETTLSAGLETVVYSDCDKILSKAESFGAKVDLTPEHINNDPKGHFLALRQACLNHPSDQLVYLQATCPLTTVLDLQNCINLMEQGAKAVISVVKSGSEHPLAARKIQDGILVPFQEDNLNLPTEFLPACYYPNGAIAIVPTNSFIDNLSFWSIPAVAYIMDRSKWIDIDFLHDFLAAEILHLINRGEFKVKNPSPCF